MRALGTQSQRWFERLLALVALGLGPVAVAVVVRLSLVWAAAEAWLLFAVTLALRSGAAALYLSAAVRSFHSLVFAPFFQCVQVVSKVSPDPSKSLNPSLLSHQPDPPKFHLSRCWVLSMRSLLTEAANSTPMAIRETQKFFTSTSQ